MRRYFIVSILIVAGAGCSKNYLNDTILPPSVLASSSSSIRLYNLFGFPVDVTVNNIPLTSYSTTGTNGTALGLSIFPSGVWNDGTSFTIPSTLLDKNGQVHISISPRVFYAGTSPITLPVDTLLTNTPLQPVDYFLLSDGHYHALPRLAAVPAQPTDFKIRIINLGTAADVNQLNGLVTVSYADGSPVDPKLTGIAPGQVSDYVELSYAAIEFKVFVNGDFTKQLTELPLHPNYIGGTQSPVFDQEARFGPTRTFKPGGVYNLFISNNVIQYEDDYGTPIYKYVNAYRVIAENSPGVNVNFARIQGINTYPADGALTLTIDGTPLGKSLAFRQYSDYSIQVRGTHTVQAYDANGGLMAQKNITLYPYDNITAWVYQHDSVPDIAFSAMDMSQVQTGLLFDCMNLCTGLPYLTFTNDAYPFYSPLSPYQRNDTATTNVPFAQPVPFSAYVWYDLTPFQTAGAGSPIISPGPSFYAIRAYQSDPGPPLQIPGSYLDIVTPIHPSDFVANPLIYSTTPGPAEPGAYTVALIGKLDADTTGPYRPRILILKHSK